MINKPIIIIIFMIYASSSSLLMKISQGETVTHLLPLEFRFQHKYEISSLYNNETLSDKPLCTIEQRQEISQKVKNSVQLKVGKNQSQYKIINRIEDIGKLGLVLDVISFNDQVIVLFESLQLYFYDVDENGKISLKQRSMLNHTLNGQIMFISNNKYCFIVCGNKLLKLKNDRTWVQMQGFQKINQNFSQAKLHQQTLIITAKIKGIYHYSIYENQVKFLMNYQPTHKHQALTPKHLDFNEQLFYMIDQVRGLYTFKLPTDGNQVNAHPTPIQQRDCAYLFVNKDDVYLNCNRFILYKARQNETKSQYQLTLYPHQILLNGSQLIFLSHHSFGISDNIQLGIEKGYFDEHIHKTVLHNNHLISLNDFTLMSWHLFPAFFYVKCQTFLKDQTIQGRNKGTIKISGQCRDKPSQICHKTEEIILEVNYPIDFPFVQIIGTLVFMVCACICGIKISIKHLNIRKGYMRLQQHSKVKDFMEFFSSDILVN